MSAKVAGPRPAEDGPILVESLLETSIFLLFKATAKVRDHYEEALKPLGINGRHLSLMIAIEERGSITQHQMGRSLCTDRSSMVQLVDDLEKIGFVERRDVPEDRRAHAIALTILGKQRLPEAKRLGAEAEKKFLSHLAPAQRRSLLADLKDLVLAHYAGPEAREAKS
jgi:DNA-binding MarR family transcriptional regulator